MNRPRLVIRAPEVSLVIDFLGIHFPVLWLFILPFFFSLAILRLLAILFLTLVFSFPFAFSFSRRRGLKVLG